MTQNYVTASEHDQPENHELIEAILKEIEKPIVKKLEGKKVRGMKIYM